MGACLRRPGRWRQIGIMLFGVLLGVSASAFASHNFDDVPDRALYHDAAEWLVNRAITLGCTARLFCPNDFVTRAQMALFMQRLGTALTPTYLTRTEAAGMLDLDTAPTVCPTTTDYTPAYPQTAVVYTGVSVQKSSPLPLGFMWYGSAVLYSTNGGLFWLSPPQSASVPASAFVPGAFHPLFNIAALNLEPGISYRFAIWLVRFGCPAAPGCGGDADIGIMYCRLVVKILNRNPGSSPLGPARSAPQQRR